MIKNVKNVKNDQKIENLNFLPISHMPIQNLNADSDSSRKMDLGSEKITRIVLILREILYGLRKKISVKKV